MTQMEYGRGVCRLLVVFLLSSTATVVAQSPEWVHWGGPNRDFKSDATGLATSWPETGPPRLWSRDLGEGYSAISVQGGRLYTMYRRDDREVVIAVEAATGKTVWEFAYDAPFIMPGREADPVEFNLEQGPGPHSMPAIVGNRLFTLGTTGWLHCLDRNTGKAIWAHNLLTKFRGGVKKRGYAATPLAYKDTVIVPVGAAGASIVAFNQKDGAIVWQKHDFRPAYANPTLIDVDGQVQFIAFMREWLVGVDPDNGDLFWSHPLDSSNGTHVSTPIWGEDHLLFFSAAYGLGSHVIKLTRSGTKTTVKELWHSPRFRVHFSNAMRLGDVIYASTGDFGPAFFTAVDIHTGKILWRERGLSRASFLHAEGRFTIIDKDGTLVLATPSAEGLTIHSEVELLADYRPDGADARRENALPARSEDDDGFGSEFSFEVTRRLTPSIQSNQGSQTHVKLIRE